MIQKFKFPHIDPEGDTMPKQLTCHHGSSGLWETGQLCLTLLIWVSVYWDTAGSWPVLSPPSWQVRRGMPNSATHALSTWAGPTFPTQEQMAEGSPFLFQPWDRREVGLVPGEASHHFLLCKHCLCLSQSNSLPLYKRRSLFLNSDRVVCFLS